MEAMMKRNVFLKRAVDLVYNRKVTKELVWKISLLTELQNQQISTRRTVSYCAKFIRDEIDKSPAARFIKHFGCVQMAYYYTLYKVYTFVQKKNRHCRVDDAYNFHP